MDVWFTETQHNGLRYSCQIKDVLYSGESQYQKAAVYDTVTFGKMLTLDGCVMTTDRDEFIYHEMITHVPLMAHPNPEKVLVIGGGDGGAIREIVKHKSVKLAHLVEIDQLVIDLSKKYFPQIACELDNPRVKVSVADGIEYVKNTRAEYDVICIDSTDPVGPAVGLFAQEFFEAARNALRPGGILVAQTESPLFNGQLIGDIATTFKRLFNTYRLYWSAIPTYPSGSWCFSMGTLGPTGDVVEADRFKQLNTKFYTPSLHAAAFAVPRYVEEYVK